MGAAAKREAMIATAPVGAARGELTRLVRGQSLVRLAARELLRNPGAVAGLIAVGLIVLAALLAPLIAPFDPIATSPAESSVPPSAVHLMGTDILGRDVLSRVIFGTRISIWLGLISV